MTERNRVLILMADDDPEDRMLAEDAFAEAHLKNELRFVEDGEELMDYLHRRGAYAEPGAAPRPGMILLDLNMPRKDGREALSEIRADSDLESIPVVILTTSKAEEDILRTYKLGVNSFITKPVTFEGMVEIVQGLARYWFEIVELPSTPFARAASAPGQFEVDAGVGDPNRDMASPNTGSAGIAASRKVS